MSSRGPLDPALARRRLNTVRLPLAAAPAALFVVLLLAASGAGSPILLAGVNHVKPFKGTSHIGQALTAFGCGANSSFVVLPQFNMTTGVGLLQERATATGCGLPGFSDNASAQGIAGFDSKVIPLGGVKTDVLSFNYSFNYTYSLAATPKNPAGGPFAWSAITIEFVSVLLNLTTLKAIGGLYSYVLDTTNYSSNGFKNGTLGLNDGITSWPIVPNTNDRYVVMMYFVVTIWVHAPAGTATHANAKFNMGTGPHKYVAKNWAWN